MASVRPLGFNFTIPHLELSQAPGHLARVSFMSTSQCSGERYALKAALQASSRPHSQPIGFKNCLEPSKSFGPRLTVQRLKLTERGLEKPGPAPRNLTRALRLPSPGSGWQSAYGLLHIGMLGSCSAIPEGPLRDKADGVVIKIPSGSGLRGGLRVQRAF